MYTVAISHGYGYKLFSEFLCKNESTTLVIKMDEQQVLKSIVNNCKTSDPTSRMNYSGVSVSASFPN